jgi:hypothetical protein
MDTDTLYEPDKFTEGFPIFNANSSAKRCPSVRRATLLVVCVNFYVLHMNVISLEDVFPLYGPS